MVVEFTGGDLGCSSRDGLCEFGVEVSEAGVDSRGGALEDSKRGDDGGRHPLAGASDVEVLEGALGLGAPEPIFGLVVCGEESFGGGVNDE